MIRSLFLIAALLFSLPAQADDHQSAFDRVMATNTIRCGYIVAPPLLAKDPNTGVLSGISYDLVERIGKELSLKIEWVEEAGFGSWQEGLATGRYDMLCTTMWATSPRARVAAFSVPVFYTAINAYVRADDHRFDGNLAVANDPAVTVAALDGSTSALIAADDFPLAKRDSLANLTDASQLLMDVQTGKADLTFEEAAKFYLFDKANPGKLRNVTQGHPVRLVTNSFFVNGDEVRLLGMINATLGNLHNSGYIGKLLDSYEPAPGTWRRVAQSFQ